MKVKDKIERIMEREQMNSLQFASEIGIQGSTLSHILNDRNKPSLDVLTKILNRFRTISSDWLILDVGSMYRTEKHSQMPSLFDSVDENSSKSTVYDPKSIENSVVENISFQQKSDVTPELKSQIQNDVRNITSHVTTDIISKQVKKIIVYYNDNTFQEFENK